MNSAEAVASDAGPIVSFRHEFAFLGNPYRCPFLWRDILWPGAEWMFQALKSRDQKFWLQIAAMPDWRDAKAAGQQVSLRPGWEQVKKRAMLETLFAKFGLTGRPELGKRLVATGNRVLVEGNTWHDNDWGDCSCKQRPECARQGLNRLGRLLMAVRYTLEEKS